MVIVESSGFLYLQLIKRILNVDVASKKINGYTINILLGMVIFAMGIFSLGVLNLLKPELIILLSLFPPVVSLFFKRWKNLNIKDISAALKNNKYTLFGLGLLSILVFICAFRPVNSFDGVWYHLAIPKMFLQQGNIDYNGILFRYSVHPYLNFFWNVWPLSLPFSTALNSIIINLIQGLVLLVTIYWSSIIGKKLFGWGKLAQFLGPIIIGTSSSFLISNIGWAYNDIYGLCFGLVTFLYIYYLSTLKEIDYFDLAVVLVLIIGLFLLKIFFGIAAFLSFLYLVLVTYDKLIFVKIKTSTIGDLKNSIFSRKFGTLVLFLTSYFVIFILPWLIRSYYFTGRILDPVGAPGLNEDAYNFAGSMTADNHWRVFIWNRLTGEIFPILFNRFTPVFGLGILAIFNSKFREKYSSIWVFSFVAFWVVYFLNIVQAYRYLFPQIVIFVFFGITLIQHLFDSKQLNKSIAILVSGVSLVFVFVNLYMSNELGVLYVKELKRNPNLDSFMLSTATSKWSNISYYQSPLSPQPADLTSKEPVFIASFVNRTAYINNPYYNPYIQQKEFAGIKSIPALVNVLKSKNIRYILNKGSSATDFCKEIGLVDYEQCTANNDYWELNTQDYEQNVSWLKLKV